MASNAKDVQDSAFGVEVERIAKEVVDRICPNGWADVNLSRKDLEQYAALAIVASKKTFDPDKGEFLPYAATVAKHAVFSAVNASRRQPEKERKIVKQFREVQEQLWRELHREPTIEEITERIPTYKLKEIEESFARNALYGQKMSYSWETDFEGGADINEQSPEEASITAEELGELRSILMKLPKQTRQILTDVNYFGDTQREVGERIGMSRENVNRIVKKHKRR
jgi:RNA polymerase sigma factor (sigma-70 family)